MDTFENNDEKIQELKTILEHLSQAQNPQLPSINDDDFDGVSLTGDGVSQASGSLTSMAQKPVKNDDLEYIHHHQSHWANAELANHHRKVELPALRKLRNLKTPPNSRRNSFEPEVDDHDHDGKSTNSSSVPTFGQKPSVNQVQPQPRDSRIDGVKANESQFFVPMSSAPEAPFQGQDDDRFRDSNSESESGESTIGIEGDSGGKGDGDGDGEVLSSDVAEPDPYHHRHFYKRRISASNFLRERILYHGPCPYLGEIPKKMKTKIERQKEEEMWRKRREEDEKKKEAEDRRREQMAREYIKTPDSDVQDEEADIEVDVDVVQFILPREMKEEEEDAAYIVRTHSIKRAKKFDDNESVMSITEKLCVLENEKKRRPTIKENYMGKSGMISKAHPECLSEIRERIDPNCLPPGDFARRAIDTEELWDIPKNKPLSRDQIIKLIRKVEKLQTNDFVLLKYSLPFKHYAFNPYSLKIVDVKNRQNNYFTMSQHGIMHFSNGLAEFTSMLQFEREMYLFDKVRKIPFFVQFIIWKTFMIWKYNIRYYKFKSIKIELEDNLFITKRPLRRMLIELFRMCEKISSMGFLSFKSGTTYDFKEFLTLQDKRMLEITTRLRAFEGMVIEMALSSCRTTLMDEGFSPDEYPREMEYYLRELEIPVDNLMKKMTVFDYPGEWLSYSKGSRKRKICYRLTNFIHLVDYFVQRAYHCLLKNSLYYLLEEMDSKLEFIDEPYLIPTKHKTLLEFLREDNSKFGGEITIQESAEPIFLIGCSWKEIDLVFVPTSDAFKSGLKTLFESWKRVVCSYPNMLPNEKFDPYTQPIVNGYMNPKNEERIQGPSLEHLLNNDDKLSKISEVIDLILAHGFITCQQYFQGFDNIRAFCNENQYISLDALENETDVKMFAFYLEKFHGQLDLINSTEDSKNLGIFQVNNSILREHAIPAVLRCLEVVDESLPLFGAKTVRELRSKMQMDLEILENYPETVDEYYDYINFLDNIVESIDEIEKQVDFCGEIYDLIEMYDVAGNEEDFKDFIELQPFLLQLRSVVDHKTMTRESFSRELHGKLQSEIDKIFTEMKTIQNELEDPLVLEPNDDPQVILSSMRDTVAQLKVNKDNAMRFNKYQRDLKFPETNFQELDQLIEKATAYNKLWEAISDWYMQEEAWFNEYFRKLDPEEMASEINYYDEYLDDVSVNLPQHNQVVNNCKEKFNFMRDQIPVIVTLKNTNLRKRHWDHLEKILNNKLTDELVTLKNLIDMKVHDHLQVIEEISAKATEEAEFNLESLLKRRDPKRKAASKHKNENNDTSDVGSGSGSGELDEKPITSTTASSTSDFDNGERRIFNENGSLLSIKTPSMNSVDEVETMEAKSMNESFIDEFSPQDQHQYR